MGRKCEKWSDAPKLNGPICLSESDKDGWKENGEIGGISGEEYRWTEQEEVEI